MSLATLTPAKPPLDRAVRPAREEVYTIGNLLKVFGEDKPYVALKNVDLTIESGEFVCLLGASGCGKSTLLNLLAGFDKPSGGQLLYRGKPIAGPGKERVMFFQDANAALLPWQTVQQNVEFGLKLQGLPAGERRARAEECLTLVNLAEHRHKVPSEISGGMRQRLQIARALAVQPDVFLMDEPFAALDAITRRRMHEALLEVWEREKRTIVFVTHDIMEALTLADRIAVMSVGPGSRIAHVVEVDRPRPRVPGDPELGRIYAQLERLLHGPAGEEAGR
ncbi:ABC transporter ATP-binding protein [Mongoliimonas terrestris]|uniref:ABC transporter ATP-binding protein n=1 Tax=Mongoliimonas terrestris TaxID=1709001 RepID=UPI0009F9B1CE|nr:ABC transporter ATP-binding protein [Mongoliimonas terrestris]